MAPLRTALLLLSAAGAALAGCPNSTWVETPDGDCLLLLPDPPFAAVTADQALETCHQEAGEATSLPEVHEQADQDAIAALADGAVVWLGLRRPDHSSPFAWPSGDEVSFTAWADGQPVDGAGLNCVAMGADGAWAADTCSGIGENVVCFTAGAE